MKKRLFTDMNINPTDSLLRKQLGSAFQYYERILQASSGFRRQWQFSRGNGWLLKVDDTRKALYYLIAFEEGIEISLTVRDAERQHFLALPELENLRSQFEGATKYTEGYALRFEIESLAECGLVAEFLDLLIAQRAAAPLSKKSSGRGKAGSRAGKKAGELKER
jgi:hypothetical protein